MPGEPVEHTYAGPMAAETVHFVEAVACDRPVLVTGEEARQVMEVYIAADLSAERLEPVNLPLPQGSTVERLPSIPLQPLLPPNLCIIVTNQGTFLVRLDPNTRSATYQRIEEWDGIED